MGAEQTADAEARAGHDAQCPIGLCAQILCQKWTALIIRDLSSGPRYYNDLMASVSGITPRMLCQRLDQLQSHNVVTRRKINGVPPRTEYALTELGSGLLTVVAEMERFGKGWLMESPECQ